MRNSPTKQLVLFVTGSVINVALFCLSKYLGFPLWLDFAGSFYITAVCGPFLGILSLILHITAVTVLIDGVCALWLAIPMAMACAVIYTANRFNMLGKPLSHLCTMFVTSIAAALGYFIVFIINYLPPARYLAYESAFSAMIHSNGKFFGTVILSLAIAFSEMIPCLAVFTAAYMLTPRPKSSLSFKK